MVAENQAQDLGVGSAPLLVPSRLTSTTHTGVRVYELASVPFVLFSAKRGEEKRKIKQTALVGCLIDRMCFFTYPCGYTLHILFYIICLSGT